MGTIDLKNKRILVTGGHGYLGLSLVNALRKESPFVFTLSRSVRDGDDHHYSVDLTKKETLNDAIECIQPDIVYHLAADLSRSRDFALYDHMHKVNVSGTLHLLQALQKTRYNHFIFISSSEIYGNNPSPFNENQIPNPVSPYSLSKITAEMLTATFSAIHGKNFTNLRLFNFYGQGMPEDFFIPQMINSLKRGNDFLMTKGEQVRDFLYVDDVVRALLLSAKSPVAYNETFNVCSGTGTKLYELAMEVNEHFKGGANVIAGALPYRENEVWEMTGDITKIKNMLGFYPKVSLAEGIKALLLKN